MLMEWKVSAMLWFYVFYIVYLGSTFFTTVTNDAKISIREVILFTFGNYIFPSNESKTTYSVMGLLIDI
jgi:hypothetical protein